MVNLLIEKIKDIIEESGLNIKENTIKICTCNPNSDTCLTVAELLEGKECGCKKYVDASIVNKELDKIVDYLNSIETK